MPAPSPLLPTAGPAASAPVSTETPPWKWPWTRWAKNEGKTFFWICLIHALTVVGLVLYPAPGWGMFGIAYGLFWLGGLGTTVAYHRSLAHKAVKLHPIIEFPLVFFALMNGSGTPATWAANHRLHHKHSDTDLDISSPRIGGFWWSHLRWLWQTEQASIEKWAPDLNKGRYLFFTRMQVPMLMVSLFAGAFWGWEAFFWIGPIRLCFALHAQCFTNSIAHLNPKVGPGEDSAMNIPWMAPLQAMQGENWHENHHSKPASARLGWTLSQIDLGWWFIVGCEKLKLASSVRRP